MGKQANKIEKKRRRLKQAKRKKVIIKELKKAKSSGK